MSRRDAAVAAALTGTVVVVLGYASGLGIQVAAPTLAPPPAQPAVPTSPAPEHTDPAMAMQPTPAMAMPVMPAMPAMPTDPMDDMPGMPEDHPTHPHPSEPTEPPEPAEPAPSPDEPLDPAARCSPALLEQLPVVGPASSPITTVLSSFLGSAPVLGELGEETDGLSCLVGSVVGPECCDAVVPELAEVAP